MQIDTGITLTTKAEKFSPTQVWNDRENWMKKVADSKAIYAEMDPEEQARLVAITRHACLRIAERAGDWIPEGIVNASGNAIALEIKIMLTDADAAIQKYTRRHFSATDDEVRELAALADEHPIVAKLIEQVRNK